MTSITNLPALVLGLQIVTGLGLGLLSRWLVKLVWHYNQKDKPANTTSLLIQYSAPLVVYAVFLSLYLSVSVGFYLYLGHWIGLKVILPLSVFFLLGRYAYIITKEFIAYLIVFIPLSIAWGLNYMDSIMPFLDYVNRYSIQMGGVKITPIGFLKGLVTVSVFFWITSIISTQVNRRIKKLDKVKPATREILTKVFDVTLYFIAGLFVLNVLGINLSTLTVLGGAIGVGVGFGLQKIISNFISGIILLVEKSIEIDDLIEMDGGIYGFIKKLGSRYTVIETFDGKEILVPNEDFITNRVTNWTFSNKAGRIDIEVGVAYNSDIKQVKALMLDAAKEHPQCCLYPPPQCFLRTFGDSSVNFLLQFFVSDVTLGRYEPQSDVMFTIWDKFKTHHIEIPFPQRDVHIKPA